MVTYVLATKQSGRKMKLTFTMYNIDSYSGVSVDCVPVVCVQCFPCVVCCREGVRWGGGWEVAGYSMSIYVYMHVCV